VLQTLYDSRAPHDAAGQQYGVDSRSNVDEACLSSHTCVNTWSQPCNPDGLVLTPVHPHPTPPPHPLQSWTLYAAAEIKP
jgi:hypothetical protein